MKIFISHKREDSQYAEGVAKVLADASIEYYLDLIDENIKTSNDLTNHFIEHIKTSTHLLAVVTYRTTQSWWVPFEVGVASVSLKKITTYNPDNIYSFPDFLRKWPILNTRDDIKKYANIIAAQESEERTAFDAATASMESLKETSAEKFHRRMKSVLNQ